MVMLPGRWLAAHLCSNARKCLAGVATLGDAQGGGAVRGD